MVDSKRYDIVNNLGDIISNDRENILLKNNKLIRINYDLTAFENKIYLFMLSLIKKKYSNNRDKIQYIEFDIWSLRALSKEYENIRVNKITNIFSKLRKKSVYISWVNDDGKEHLGEYGLINSYMYIPSTSTFRVEMSKNVTESLIECYVHEEIFLDSNIILENK